MADRLTFQFLDVGMGDGTLVQMRADGDAYDRLMLVDFGEKRSPFKVPYRDALQYLVRTINDNSEARRRSRPFVDHLILTHPDGDHYNKIAELIDANYPDFPGDDLWFGDLHYSGRKTAYGDLITDKLDGLVYADNGLDEMVNNYRSPATAAGFTHPWRSYSGTDVYMLSANWPNRYSAPNPMSIVLLFQFGSRSVILTGDATRATENHILDHVVNPDPALVDCTALKLGHHGSNGSTGQRWVDATSPGAVFASGDMVWAHPYCEPICRCLDDVWVEADERWYCCGYRGDYWNNDTRDAAQMNLWYTVERFRERLWDEEGRRRVWGYYRNAYGVQWELALERGEDAEISRTETYVPYPGGPDPPFDCDALARADLRREQRGASIEQLATASAAAPAETGAPSWPTR